MNKHVVTPRNKQVGTVSSAVPPTVTTKRNFSHFASQVAQWCGKPWAFGLAVSLVLIWAGNGALFSLF
jgi:hypothetical protein